MSTLIDGGINSPDLATSTISHHPPDAVPDAALPDIHGLVPHSGAMLLLERLLHVDAESACAEVRITAESMFATEDGVGSWVGIEYMAQTIAAFAGYQAQQAGRAVKIGFLLGARRYEAMCGHFAPGSVLRIEAIRALQGENGLGAFECTIRDGSNKIDNCGQNGDSGNNNSSHCAETGHNGNGGNHGGGKLLAKATVTVFQPPNVDEFLQEIAIKGEYE